MHSSKQNNKHVFSVFHLNAYIEEQNSSNSKQNTKQRSFVEYRRVNMFIIPEEEWKRS